MYVKMCIYEDVSFGSVCVCVFLLLLDTLLHQCSHCHFNGDVTVWLISRTILTEGGRVYRSFVRTCMESGGCY